MNLTTKRTKLSLLEKADYPEILDMFAEPDTFKYIKVLQNKTREGYTTFLDSKYQEVKARSGYYWVVRKEANNEFVGAINLTPIPKEEHKIQIGWQICRKFHRMGFATEAARAAFNFAIRDLKLTAIFGVFEKENIASQKILEQLGFTFFEKKTFNHTNILIYRWAA